MPLIHDALATLECAVHDVADGGDHQIVIGRVLAVDHPDEHAPPLLSTAAPSRVSRSTVIAAIVGSVTPPGRLRRAVEGALARVDAASALLDLASTRCRSRAGRRDAPVLDAIADADAILLATRSTAARTPASLKNLLDLLPVEALPGKPVAIVAMGATDHHHLGPDWHLRDTLAWFGALTLPTSSYLTSRDFADGVPTARAASDLDALLATLTAFAEHLPRDFGPQPLAARAPASDTTARNEGGCHHPIQAVRAGPAPREGERHGGPDTDGEPEVRRTARARGDDRRGRRAGRVVLPRGRASDPGRCLRQAARGARLRRRAPWWPLPVAALAGLIVAFAIVRLPGRGGHPGRTASAPGRRSRWSSPACCWRGLGHDRPRPRARAGSPLIALGGGLGLLAVQLLRKDAPQSSAR